MIDPEMIIVPLQPEEIARIEVLAEQRGTTSEQTIGELVRLGLRLREGEIEEKSARADGGAS